MKKMLRKYFQNKLININAKWKSNKTSFVLEKRFHLNAFILKKIAV